MASMLSNIKPKRPLFFNDWWMVMLEGLKTKVLNVFTFSDTHFPFTENFEKCGFVPNGGRERNRDLLDKKTGSG